MLTERQRAALAETASSHLPKRPAPIASASEKDIEALKAAFKKRFDEDLPRTETLLAVASVGYRMALRDLAKG